MENYDIRNFMRNAADYEELQKIITAANDEIKYRQEREREQHMRLITEYTNRLDNFIAELNDNGFILAYNEYIDEFCIEESE